MFNFKREMNAQTAVVLTALFLMVFANTAFYKNLFLVYPPGAENNLFLLSLGLLFACVNVVLLSFLCFRPVIKPLLIILLLLSSLAAYFMDSYNVVIDDAMIDNIVKTDLGESMDLLSVQQLLYFLLLGVLPAYLIYKTPFKRISVRRTLGYNLALLLGAGGLAALMVITQGDFYASFFREHKPLRYYANPSYFLYSAGKYANSQFQGAAETLTTIGEDAVIPEEDEHRELIIFVVGETARADHFSLNGYRKKTNPYLEREEVVSFTNVWSCGTSTAYSVPCMFSIYDRDDFSKSKAQVTENALDVLQHAGVNVLWLDNNSDSKGVADRVPYQSFKSADTNPVCDSECRDEGMLANLQAYIDSQTSGDIFIILHQMGNHGPAYYKRYPPQFEAFTPVCASNQLEQCTPEEISNAYDNAILYTDYFLAKTIALLKNNSQFEAAMIYASDHGESLGEDHIYLHGLPYMIAPDTQIHVPMIMWFGSGFEEGEIDLASLRAESDNKLSHDNLFHTILGLLEIRSQVYDKGMDIIGHRGTN